MFTPFDDEWRLAAKKRREQGGSTVTVYSSQRAMAAARGESEMREFHRELQEILARHESDLADLHQRFVDELYPERRIPVDLIDTF